MLMHLYWFCPLLTGYSEFVVDFVEIVTEVGQFGEIENFNSQHSLMLACLSVAARQINDGRSLAS